MLKSLSIKDYTLIDKVEINFSPNFNIFIGETGAGKSVIVGALMLALGGRAITEHIRKGQDKAVIEAIFEFPENHPIFAHLEEQNIERMANVVITRREIYLRGISRCFINDTAVPVSVLKFFGEKIANFHGQHDTQLILKPENHLEFLDLYINDDDLIIDLSKEYEHQVELLQKYSSLKSQEKELKLQRNAYEFELNEINKVNPIDGEEEKLETELKILENAELLFDNIQLTLKTLYDSEHSAYNRLTDAQNYLKKLKDIDESFAPWLEELNSTSVVVSEIAKFAQNYRDNIDYNQDRIEDIRIRLSTLNGLKKKYGSFEEIFNRIEYLENKLSLAQNFTIETEKLYKEILNSKTALGKLADKLSKLRKEKSKIFADELVKKLIELNLENSIFRIEFSNKQIEKEAADSSVTATIDGIEYLCNKKGIDSAEFFISTNKGESPKPLSTVASGGELSRVMISVKTLIAKRYKIPIFVFDEIDTGISGRIAQKVGSAIKELSQNHQIIAITHLAQIAAFGDRIISVQKNENFNKTTVTINEENDETKIIEIAKLISGENVSNASLKTVNELLNYQQ